MSFQLGKCHSVGDEVADVPQAPQQPVEPKKKQAAGETNKNNSKKKIEESIRRK